MLYNFLAKILSCTVLLGMAEVWGALTDQDRAAHWCVHEESGPWRLNLERLRRNPVSAANSNQSVLNMLPSLSRDHNCILLSAIASDLTITITNLILSNEAQNKQWFIIKSNNNVASLSIKMSSSESSFPAGQVATWSLQLGNLCQVPQPNLGSKGEPHLMYRETPWYIWLNQRH